MAYRPALQWENKRETVRAFRGLMEAQRDRVGQIPRSTVTKGIFALLALVQERTPKRTGTLVRSELAVVRERGAMVEGVVGTPMKYARYMELGTGEFGPGGRPFEVKVRSARALYWGAVGAEGKPLFAKKVMVRGAQAARMFAGSLEAFAPRYIRMVEAGLQEAAR